MPDARSHPAPRPSRRWHVVAVIVVGVLLHLPSLGAGFYADDHVHQLALAGKLPLRPWALFDFGAAADWASVHESVGGLPWWTSPEWKIRFFRPLPSVLMWLEHSLWGDWAVGYHAVSLIALAALLAAAHAAYGVLGLPPRLALVALALLASSQATVHPADWIANRNSLLAGVSTATAVAVLASHSRLGRGFALGGALVLAALACLSKESGVVAFAALAAYLALGDHGLPMAWSRRAALVAMAMGVAYVVSLGLAGFGTRSAFYATPWTDPGRYLANLGAVFTVGALALGTPVPSDLVFVAPQLAPALIVAGLLLGGALLAWARKRLRGERNAAFLAAWTLLSLAPEAGAPLQDRLLLGATLGAAPLLAMLLSRTLPASASRPRFERAAAWTLLVFAALEALMTLGLSASTAQMAARTRQVVADTDAGSPELGRREVLVLQSDDPLVVFALPATWIFHTRDEGVRFHALQTGRRAVRWTRLDERRMEFEALDRPFVTDPFETVYRADRRAFPDGFASARTPVRFEVVRREPTGGVWSVRVEFDEAPESERFRFLVPRDGRLVRVAAPEPGQSVPLPEAPRAHPFVP